MSNTSEMQKPGLEDVLRAAIDAGMAQTHVSMPGIIRKYDVATHLADVQPSLLDKGVDSSVPQLLPVIPRVPVLHPRVLKGAVIMPVSVGDLVTLLFSDRALSRWKLGAGQPVEPGDGRRHHLTDCVALLGGHPEKSPLPLVPSSGNMVVYVMPGTGIHIGNGLPSLDLITAMWNLATAIGADTNVLGSTKAAGIAAAAILLPFKPV